MNKCIKIICLVAMIFSTALFAGCDEDSAKNENFLEDVPNITQDMQVKDKFPEFIAKDINGNQVSNEIFTQKKLTVVNIWGTFCPPCIGEMPELGKLAREMPSDVQIIGIVCDVRGNDDFNTINAAKKILEDANADFLNIVPNAEINTYLQNVDAVPTTIFVNSQGEVIGNPIIGADVDGYTEFVKEYMNAQN